MSPKPRIPREPRFALDTSALLAMMQSAPGGSIVGAKLHHSAISTVNMAEVLDYSRANDIDTEGMLQDLEGLGLRIEPLSAQDAYDVANMFDLPKLPVLSLSDRACLVLAHRLGVPALTADEAWGQLDLGVEIQVLR